MRARLVSLLTLSVAALFTVRAPLARAYVRRTITTDLTSAPLIRPDAATGIQFLINNQLVAGLQSTASGSNVTVLTPNSDPVGAARNALATWNGVAANVKFLPLQSTSLVHNARDGNNVILLATTNDDVSYVGGALAVTANSFYTNSGVVNGVPYSAGTVIDSDILLNPGFTFSTDGNGSGSGVEILNGNTTSDLQAVLTHELGHALGASHSGVWGATMFQFAALGQRFPSTDDLSFVRSVYPLPDTAATLGTIQGAITISGAGPVSYGLLTLIDTTQRITIGALTGADGTYSIQVPAGSYAIYAEPFNPLVQPGNLYLSAAQAAVASTFQPTIFGGASNSTTVTAGSTATASFAVASGTTTLTFPLVGFGKANTTGDVATFSAVSGPQIVPSGGPLDFVFTGPGYDATLTTANFQVFGGGVTIVAGPLRKDTVTVNNLPVYRITLNIAPSQTASLASLFITIGSNTLSMSGVLCVTPATPAFISKGVINAASYLGSGEAGAVSPGGIYTVYAGSGAVGPPVGVNNGGFDAYNSLPTTLAGVTVYFDGVAAPIFYVRSDLINVQVPFETAAKIGLNTNVVVSYYGATSAPVAVPVFADQPGFFTISPAGNDSLVVNYKDGLLNSAAHPAKQGDYVLLFGTGIGVTTAGVAKYGLQTGVGAPYTPAGYDGGHFSCTVGNTKVPAPVAWAAGFAGLAQWNLQVPTGATGQLSLQCIDADTNGGTQIGTIWVN
jgi:uncharacterized protein (TIGR03437 family)